MTVFKQCLKQLHRIPTTDYHCEQCEMNWEGDETGKWAEHYFKKWQEAEEKLKKYRNICDNCFGAGVRQYPSTSGWRGGIAGQAITTDVCDTCWGSGDAEKPFLDLRKLRKVLTPEQVRELKKI